MLSIFHTQLAAAALPISRVRDPGFSIYSCLPFGNSMRVLCWKIITIKVLYYTYLLRGEWRSLKVEWWWWKSISMWYGYTQSSGM